MRKFYETMFLCIGIGLIIGLFGWLISQPTESDKKLNFIEKHYNVKVVEVITDGVKNYEIKEVK